MAAKSGKRKGRPADPTLTARRSEEILEAATRLFALHGFARTDLQFVAEDLGVGKGTIYRYFPSKEALFLAAVDRGMQALAARVNAVRDQWTEEDPLNMLEAVIRSFLEFFSEHPELVELFVQERAAFRDRHRPVYFQHQDQNIGQWQDLFHFLMETGRVRELPVERVLDILGDLLYGTMFANHFAGRRGSPAAQASDITDLVYFGILSREERECRRSRTTQTQKDSAP